MLNISLDLKARFVVQFLKALIDELAPIFSSHQWVQEW